MACTRTCCPGTPVIPAQPVISRRAARRAEGRTPTPHQGCGHHGPAPAGLAKPELCSAQGCHCAVSHGSQGPLPRPSPDTGAHRQPAHTQPPKPGTPWHCWPARCATAAHSQGHVGTDRAPLHESRHGRQLPAARAHCHATQDEARAGRFWCWEMGVQGQRPTSRAAAMPFHEGSEEALLAGGEHRVKTCLGD